MSINVSNLPPGFMWELTNPPSPRELNKLLSRCGLRIHQASKLSLAFQNSNYNLSILDKQSRSLAGFVRITSDKGLNANLWDFVAEPGEYQNLLLMALISRVLKIIKRDMPGCSLSIAAPGYSTDALKNQGFLIDPEGIRTMSLRLTR